MIYFNAHNKFFRSSFRRYTYLSIMRNRGWEMTSREYYDLHIGDNKYLGNSFIFKRINNETLQKS